MKQILTALFVITVFGTISAKQVTISVPGTLVRTEKTENPSTCETTYTTTCTPSASTCLSITYDDSTAAIGGENLLFEEGTQTPAHSVTVHMKNGDEYVNIPLVEYHEYNLLDPALGLARAYQFVVTQ